MPNREVVAFLHPLPPAVSTSFRLRTLVPGVSIPRAAFVAFLLRPTGYGGTRTCPGLCCVGPSGRGEGIRRNLSEVEKKRYLVEDWSALLDDWSEQDSLRDRVSTYRYSTLGGTPLEWSQKLTNLCGEHSIRIAFTQWIAGWLRTPYTEPVVTSAYVDRPPDPSLLDKLQLREVPDAGKIWLHVPEDEGVFRETRTVQGLPLVTDAQIYVDLQDTGLRGPDQAAALRTWEGFCRP